ncbi:hypothetical protein ACIQRE_02655 [Streptomyces griseoluteus]|uniref:hypothetical protein n=1 Tax=Streptomyces griseoluteus TaxID=29306 RepID=UPI00381431A5
MVRAEQFVGAAEAAGRLSGTAANRPNGAAGARFSGTARGPRAAHLRAGRRHPRGTALAASVTARRGVPPVAPRWVGPVLLGLGLAMIPWVVHVHTSLPATAEAPHWAWAWTGLDVLEALGLSSTGLLLRRGDARASLTAMAASALLVVDAWFDTMTAAPGADLASAVAMALCAEIPLAAACALLAWRGFPHTRRGAGDEVNSRAGSAQFTSPPTPPTRDTTCANHGRQP